MHVTSTQWAVSGLTGMPIKPGYGTAVLHCPARTVSLVATLGSIFMLPPIRSVFNPALLGNYAL
jgi:hypothetical protein